MTSREQVIARRVAASPHFRWMPGMLDYHLPVRVEPDDDDRGCTVPDLTDPATLGCLHALACERWGVDAITPLDGPDGPEWCGVIAGYSAQYVSARIPADITSAFPVHPHSAAVCAALLDEALP